MSEDEKIAYLQCARRAGDREASALVVSMLVWGFMEIAEHRVSMKVPPQATEEVAQSVLLSALTSEFDGSSVGEFRKFMGTIVMRRIADYHRDPKRDVRLEALPTEHQDSDEIWGDEPAVGFAGDTIDAQRALDQAYNELSDKHKKVIDLYIFGDLAAADVAERAGVSEANVHQIAHRFRDRFDELFGDDGNT
jgi:RNA polymerase sigma factor (sigma-70 family)